MPNRLANEKSPYLLQHADNPVDWYPWSNEAFEKAKTEDKPVFLSIGYATCHWCHVMAHESFEDEEVARLMNGAFINIKVDREERPDIDNTYMTICQMMTGQGGWPLTIIMTPEKEPFFAATYLPKQSRQNRIGMLDLVPQIEQAWKNRRDEIKKSTGKILEHFSQTLELSKNGGKLEDNILEQAVDELSRRFDSQFGGFGTSPKFPSPHNLIFLLHTYRSDGDDNALNMALRTLEFMRYGGIFDHIGGGFHRYSTDRKWLLPHFEKMLYDQAMLILAYTLGWQHSKKPLLKDTVYRIVEYIERDLLSESGGFYSAEDADSEGEEGKFYVWEKEEIESLLDKEDADFISRLFNVTDDGNFRDEATGERTGANILHLSSLPAQKEMEKADSILQKLKRERENRIRPLLDDKILTDWNGLIMAALSKAGAVFGDKNLIGLAERVFLFIDQNMSKEDGGLQHRFKDGDAAIDGMANDYAFVIWGLIELYEATFNLKYLRKSIELNRHFEKHFRDESHGGYYFTSEKSEKLLGRQKEIYDGAIPSSNSVQILNQVRIARLTGDTGFEEKAVKDLHAFAKQVNHTPTGYLHALQTLFLTGGDSHEIVITSEKKNEVTDQYLKIIRTAPLIEPAIHLKTSDNHKVLAELAPFTGDFSIKEQELVYICKNFSCDLPVKSSKDLKNKLEF